MSRVWNFVRSDYANIESHELLSSPVTALLGVGKDAADALRSLQVYTVFDLATSKIFNNASDIVETAKSSKAAPNK